MRNQTRTIRYLLAATLLTVGLGTALAAVNPKSVVSSSANTVSSMKATRNTKGIPSYVIKNAKAVAIIPSVTKVGLVIAGHHGVGVLVKHKGKGDWSNPVFMSFDGGSVGLQAGAESSNVVLVFMKDKDVKQALNGNIKLGANGSIVAGPVQEEGSTENLGNDIYSYTRSNGVFAGVSLNGSKLSVDNGVNKRYYGKSVHPDQIVAGNDVQTPPSTQKLKKAIHSAEESTNQMSSVR